MDYDLNILLYCACLRFWRSHRYVDSSSSRYIRMAGWKVWGRQCRCRNIIINVLLQVKCWKNDTRERHLTEMCLHLSILTVFSRKKEFLSYKKSLRNNETVNNHVMSWNLFQSCSTKRSLCKHTVAHTKKLDLFHFMFALYLHYIPTYVQGTHTLSLKNDDDTKTHDNTIYRDTCLRILL